MADQVIILVEADRQSKSDQRYIDATMKQYFDCSKMGIKYLYIGTKTRYLKQEKLIQQNKRQFESQNPEGKTHVIFCIDTDQYDSNNQVVELNQRIEQFCKKQNYHLAWFCEDIESVYLGRRIAKTQKSNEAKRFLTAKSIQKMDVQRLRKEQSCGRFSKGYSNLMIVLERTMNKKNHLS